jgi:hypothetical protein
LSGRDWGGYQAGTGYQVIVGAFSPDGLFVSDDYFFFDDDSILDVAVLRKFF